jgi:hypothetical protein
MEGRGKRRPCYLFRRIVETETDTVYEYRANEGTVIRTKVRSELQEDTNYG